MQKNFFKTFFLDDIETEDQTNDQNTNPDSFNSKRSLNIFPVKKQLEGSNDQIPMRKYTLESSMNISDFVPKPKPLKVEFLPSKLRLNKKGFKDLKCNKDNQILLESNNYYISCPNSDESFSDSDEDQYFHLRPKGINGMKDLRKNLGNEKKNLPKIMTKEVMNNQLMGDDYEEELFSEEESNGCQVSNEEGKPIENEKRFNSCSILQILESNTKH